MDDKPERGRSAKESGNPLPSSRAVQMFLLAFRSNQFSSSPSPSQSSISTQLIADYANQLEIYDNTLVAYTLPFDISMCLLFQKMEDDPKYRVNIKSRL